MTVVHPAAHAPREGDMAEWMAWDHWLARNGLRAVDWEPGEEYVRLDTLAYGLAEVAMSEDGDERLQAPEFAPLASVLVALCEIQRDDAPAHQQPGVRKVLFDYREHAETVFLVIRESRQPRVVADILGVSYQSMYDAFHAHELGQPMGKGQNPASMEGLRSRWSTAS